MIVRLKEERGRFRLESPYFRLSSRAMIAWHAPVSPGATSGANRSSSTGPCSFRLTASQSTPLKYGCAQTSCMEIRLSGSCRRSADTRSAASGGKSCGESEKWNGVGAAGGSTEWEWGWGLLLDGYVLVRVGFGRAQKHGGGQYIIRSTASSPPRPIGCNRWHRSYAPPLFSLPLSLASISPPHTPTHPRASSPSPPLLLPSSPPLLRAFHSNRRLTHRGEHDRADGEDVHKDRLGRRIAERCLPRQQLVYDHTQSPPVDIPGSDARTGRSVTF